MSKKKERDIYGKKYIGDFKYNTFFWKKKPKIIYSKHSKKDLIELYDSRQVWIVLFLILF